MESTPRSRSRIALLIESDGAGGAERIVATLARALEGLGHSVVVYVPPRGEGWLGRQLEGSSVEIDHFWLTRPFDPGCARELASSFRFRGIDVAHSHEFSMAFYGSWAARLAGIPHLITMHGGEYYAGRLRRRLAMRKAVTSSARTIAVSQTLARHLIRDLMISRRRVAFIPNGVQLLPVAESTLRQELRLEDGEELVVSVGSLYPVKGHRYLLEAAALLSQKHPRLHLAIAGRGEQRDSLVQIAARLGLEQRLHLLGLRSDVANVLGAADVFALPSLAEGLPLALLEAMLASCPVVASDVGEVADVLKGKAGVLVRPRDAASLADGLDRMLSHRHEARRMADLAARRARAEYSLDRMVSRYDALYQEVLNQPDIGDVGRARAAALPRA